MISPWIVYLINIADSLRFVGYVFFGVSVTLLDFLVAICAAEKREFLYFKKVVYILLLGMGFLTFIPSKGEIAGIMVTKIAREQHPSIEDTVLLKGKILRIINGCKEKDQ